MPLQTAGGGFSPSDAYTNIRNLGFSAKSTAQNDLNFMVSNSINTDFVFTMLDQINSFNTAFTAWKATTGLDAYATSLGYTGSMVSDCGTCITQATAIVTWVVQNFPVEADGFLKAYKLNADGSRSPSTFTPVQTAGLQTALQNFINTIN